MALNIGAGVGGLGGTLGIPNITFTNPSGAMSMAPASAYTLPAGSWLANCGFGYLSVEHFDSIAGYWKPAQNALADTPQLFDSDGSNVRIVNRTGCPVAADITNVGSGYTNGINAGLVATISAGGSLWTTVVGGAINTTVTVTTAGVYNYVPTLIFSDPPPGGIRATAIAVISAAAISSVTVINAGAGYTSAPKITIVRDPRDTGTTNGVLTVNATLAGSGTLTALYPTDFGTAAQTSVPTLSFSGGGGSNAAATVMMNFSVTAYTVSNGGAVYGNAQPTLVVSGSGVAADSTAGGFVMPLLGKGVCKQRNCMFSNSSTAGGAVQAAGQVIVDGGWGFTRIPDLYVQYSGTAALPTTTAIVAATVGGNTDTLYLQRTGT
jgi:hypothetical protein